MNEKHGEVIIYTSDDGVTKINVNLHDETVWLSLDQMAELFQRDKSTISRHIKNIFTEGELQEHSVVAKFATTAADGKIYQVDYYNLDVIISVGYRVKSLAGTRFRIWANSILKEYIKKGFAIDDERLKGNGGGSYWKELLDRIRDIRSSEKILYRQVLDLYATSIDYDPKSEESLAFLRLCKINCIMQLTDIPQQKLFMTEPMLKSRLWDLKLFRENFQFVKISALQKII